MKVYTTEQIRNVALAGHNGSGKTALAEAMLFLRKHINRMGKTEDGNTVSDFDPEEIARQMSISASLLPVELPAAKINIVDLPGFRDFIGEIRNGMAVCGCIVIVVDAQGGFEVGAEFAFDTAKKLGLPVAFFINKLDKENADFDAALDKLRAALPNDRFLPLSLPVGHDEGLKGVVDLVNMKAMTTDGQKVSPGPIPDDLLARAQELREEIMDEAAADDEELAMKFLEGEELTPEEILGSLKKAFIEKVYHPVFAGSAVRAVGAQSLMNFMEVAFPNPAESPKGYLVDIETGEPVEERLEHSDGGPPTLFVWKTAADKFGVSSYVQVAQGTLTKDAHLRNLNHNQDERVSHIYWQRGKEHKEIEELRAGDLGVLLKLAHTRTNDTLGQAGAQHRLAAPPYPKQTVFMAVHCEDAGDEDKLGQLINKLCAQDPTLSVRRDSELSQTIVSGMGDMHLDVLMKRVAAEKIKARLETPRTPYRETVQGRSEGSYRHKKQSGGKGQFGEVHLRVAPNERGAGFDFDWKIVGGVIPSKYEPSVKKGIESSMERGIIAGYTVVDVKAECYDGKQHDVDSSDMAFQLAASMCFRDVAKTAKPIILEPIYTLKVTVPEEYMGDVLGHLNSKRGRIMNQDMDGGKAKIEAHVPLAEMYEYSRELRSMTHGRGVFELDYDHYEPVPGDVQAKLVEAHNGQNGEGHH